VAIQAINGLPTRRRIVLTGTPIQNDLQEFFAIVDFCNPGILGTAAAFRKIYEEPIVASRQPNCSAEERELGECRAAELTRLTSLFCLRRTHEVIQRYLPDKEENVVFCRPTAVQLSLYRRVLDSRIVKSCLAGWSMQSEDGSRHLVCIGALKKLCNCPRLLYNDIITKRNDDSNELSLYNDLQDVVAHFHSHETTMDTEESGKLQVLVKMLQNLRERKNERVVLVSNYTKTLDLLQRVCESFDYPFLRLDGSTPSNKRLSLVDQFNKHGQHCAHQETSTQYMLMQQVSVLQLSFC
jgi:DNA repair and recombination protein RAD54B